MKLQLNSKVAINYLNVLTPTLNFGPTQIEKIPSASSANKESNLATRKCIDLSKTDWDSYETSWDFTSLPLLQSDYRQPSLKPTYTKINSHWREMTQEMQQLEEENNRIFIEAYGLQDELTPDVPLSEITLTCNPHYRYGGDKSEDELESLLLSDSIRELISYAIGCMMGRYSLDHPGLIYAHSGNENFWEIYNHKTNTHSDNPSLRSLRLCGEFQPDEDGIIPVMDLDWFPDDAANRFVEFLKVAWFPDTLEDNLKFVAGSLKPKRGEPTTEAIRRYLSTYFFKDHLKIYKKRPIYWMFSSGKQKAFECLVYLHRYNEATLSRMRSSYVTPLQGKFNARMEYLRNEIDAATTASAQKKMQKVAEAQGSCKRPRSTTTSSQKKLQKARDSLKKKQAELTIFDEKLRHYADKRIELDLDDGVKVNYGKFGDLLAEKKTVTGKK